MSTLAQIKKKSIWVAMMLREESSLSLYWVGFVTKPVPSSYSLHPTNNCFIFNEQQFLKKTDPQCEQCHFEHDIQYEQSFSFTCK